MSFDDFTFEGPLNGAVHALQVGMLHGHLSNFDGLDVRFVPHSNSKDFVPVLQINIPLDNVGAYRPVYVHVLPPADDGPPRQYQDD